MDTVVVVVAIVAMLQVGNWYSQLSKIVSLYFRLPLFSPIKGSDLPEEYQAFHRAAYPPLKKMGFKLVGVVTQRSSENLGDSKIYVTQFYNESLKTYAWMHNSISPVESDPVLLKFQTHFDNGVILLTDNEYYPMHLVPPQRLIENSVASENPEEIYQSHGKDIERYLAKNSNVSVISVTSKEALVEHNNAWVSDFDSAKSNQDVYGDKDSFHLSIKQSWKLLGKYQKRTKLRAKVLSARQSNPDADPQSFSSYISHELLVRPQIDMAKFLIKSLVSPNLRSSMAWVTFLFSGVLFCAFFGFWLGWEIVPILLAVILLHELGHYAAMKLSGYTQTSIFFVPGLGAAAAGNAGQATYWQRLFVYYAGPIPGIVLAFVLWFIFPDQGGWLDSLLMVLIILNWFNLLPLMPLDGGQAINLCFRENGRFIFAWLSAAGLILLAWALSEPILWVIGSFAAYSAFARIGLHSLRRDLQKISDETKDEDEFYEKSLRIMQAPAYRQLDFPIRVNLIKEFLEEFHMDAVKWYEKVVGIFVYFIAFLSPIILFLFLSFSALDFGEPVPERNWLEEISTETDREASLMLAMEAADYYIGIYDAYEAEIYLQLVNEKIIPFADVKTFSSEVEALNLRYYFIEPREDYDALETVKKIEDYLEKNPVRDDKFFEVLRLSFENVLYLEDPISEKLLLLMEDYLKLHDRQSELAETYIQFGFSLKDHDEKVYWLQKAVEISAPEDKNYRLIYLAEAYIDMKRYMEALKIYSSLEKNNHLEDPMDYEGYAWATYKDGNHRKSLEIYNIMLVTYEESVEGGFIVNTLLGMENHLEYMKLSIIESQLVVADEIGDQKLIEKYANAIKKLTNKKQHQNYIADKIKQYKSSLKYSKTGWRNEVIRSKLVVLERYFDRQ